MLRLDRMSVLASLPGGRRDSWGRSYKLVIEKDLMAARGRRKFVGMAEFEAAKKKVLMGAERQ